MNNFAAEYTITGRADSEEYAKAERLGQILRNALPSFSVTTKSVHPTEWKSKTTTVEVVSAGGVKYNTFEEFQAKIEHLYGIKWTLDHDLIIAITQENMHESSLKYQDYLDEKATREEREASERGCALRTWALALGREIEAEHVPAARSICSEMREVKSKTAALVSVCHAHKERILKSMELEGQHYDQQMERTPILTPHQQEPTTTASASENPSEQTTQQPRENQQREAPQLPINQEQKQLQDVIDPSQQPVAVVPQIANQLVDPAIEAAKLKAREEAVRGLVTLVRFQKAVESCKPFPVSLVSEMTKQLNDSAGQMKTVDPKWQLSSHWSSWHSVASSSFGYLQTQCLEAEEIRSNVLRLSAELRSQLQSDGTPQPEDPPILEQLYTLADRLCELAIECSSSASHLYKAVVAEVKELRSEEFLKIKS